MQNQVLKKSDGVGADQERIYHREKKEGLNVIKYNLKNEQQQKIPDLVVFFKSNSCLNCSLECLL